MQTTHKAICGCCNGPATVTMDGESFHHGTCERCGTILTAEPALIDHLAQRAREAERPKSSATAFDVGIDGNVRPCR
jgi:Fe2+ or Zn2+ uptake regulation protein